MNEKKNFSRRTTPGERRNDRNTFKDVKEFVLSCDTANRNEELEPNKNIPENIRDSFSMRTDQFRLSEISDVSSSKFIENRSFNFNSNLSSKKTNSDGDNFSSRGSCAEKSDLPSIPKTGRRVRHLPFRTISQETIANISRKVGKLKEVINTGHVSTSAIAGTSSNMTSRKLLPENKLNAIILPKEHFQVLHDRIKSEIENLKCLESGEKHEQKKESDSESDDDLDLEELGSDIQFLPAKKREKIQKKINKLKCDEKKSEIKREVENQLTENKPILTIDLTKDSSLSDVTEKTEIQAENDYPSLDLDYGSKINWDDAEKHSISVKHSTAHAVCEKAIINLDIDESKLTVETTKKIEDIKNRLGRSLSIGLTHKEAEKEVLNASAGKSNVINIQGAGGGDVDNSSEDAETLELASLRCTSERTEVIADRERRRQRRCADYPGLAFGFSIFSSDTMMKFNIIRNELHNIMNTQLKRVCTDYISYFLELFTAVDELCNKINFFHVLEFNTN